MSKCWVIGGDVDCEITVSLPTVSGRHCRLIRIGERYLLEDLGSTNGTFVNGGRIAGRCVVTRRDAVTLGVSTPLPWPTETTPHQTVLLIGREPDNDVVVDQPVVSGYHALARWDSARGEAWIEDLRSSNGTAIGSPGRKITQSILSARDAIYLGSQQVSAAQVLAQLVPTGAAKLVFEGNETIIGRDPGCDCVIDSPQVSGRHARVFRANNQVLIEDLQSTSGVFVNGRRIDTKAAIRNGDVIGLGGYRLEFAFAPSGSERVAIPATLQDTSLGARSTGGSAPAPQADQPSGGEQPWRLVVLGLLPLVFAVGVLLAYGWPVENEAVGARLLSRAQRTAGLLSWIAVAAVALGLANAVFSGVLGRDELLRGFRAENAVPNLVRLGILGGLCLFQTVLLWIPVAIALGLRAPAVASLAFVVAACSVGLGLGLVVRMLSPRPEVARGIVAVAVLLLAGVGRGPASLPDANWARVIAGIAPSRWAFEGLVCLEASARSRTGTVGTTGVEFGRELVRSAFPVVDQRSGSTAAGMALALMAAGVLGAAGLISWAVIAPEGPEPAFATGSAR